MLLEGSTLLLLQSAYFLSHVLVLYFYCFDSDPVLAFLVKACLCEREACALWAATLQSHL